MYSYALPEQAQLDEQVLPNVGLSDRFVVLSASEAHTRRLLNTAPLVAIGPLSNPERPMAAAAHFDWPGLVDAVGPWIFYALEQNVKDATVAPQVQTVLDVLKCCRGFASTMYFEGDVRVTHTLSRFRDLQEPSP
jgi:hypothetical protein